MSPHRTPVVHVSSRYPASRGCLAMIAPLAVHPQQPNGVIVFDLDVDPAPLLELDADEIADRVFVSRADLARGCRAHSAQARARQPLACAGAAERAQGHRSRAHRARSRARACAISNACNRGPDLAAKLQARVRRASRTMRAARSRTRVVLGFPARCRQAPAARSTPRAERNRSDEHELPLRDPRYAELLFRYRARNWPQSLDAEDQARWQEWRRRDAVQRNRRRPR